MGGMQRKQILELKKNCAMFCACVIPFNFYTTLLYASFVKEDAEKFSSLIKIISIGTLLKLRCE